MKKKNLIIIMILTLLFSILFSQTALGAGYYQLNGQKPTVNRNTNTYYNVNRARNDKTEDLSVSQQKIYYVYPSAAQNEGYYPVFINRSTGYDVQKTPVRPEPVEPEPAPERPPVGPEPVEPEPKPEPERPPVRPEPEPQPQPERPPVGPEPVEPEPQPQPERPPVRPEPEPQPQPKPEPEPERPGSHQLTASEQNLIDMINNERIKAGLNALEIDRELSKVARLKSEDMDKNNYFSHTSPTYGSPFTMIKDFGITYRNAGENIAKTYSVERAHEGFMNSEGHRRNILTPGFTHIGVGISGYYYTEMFITK